MYFLLAGKINYTIKNPDQSSTKDDLKSLNIFTPKPAYLARIKNDLKISVVDPNTVNTLNLHPDPEFWPN